MGIAFRGKTSTGAPSAGVIKERELEINLEDQCLFTSSDGTDIIKIGCGIETGGNAWSTTTKYSIGDMVATNPGGFVHHAVTANTNIDPATDNGTNWTQPPIVIPVYEYNFLNTDTLGTASGGAPGGPHDHEFGGGTPDENGEYFFSVEQPSLGKTAEVYVDGFKLPPTEYDLTTDGYVEILSPVSLNSWVQIKI